MEGNNLRQPLLSANPKRACFKVVCVCITEDAALNCRGCGRSPGVSRKCSDLIFDNVPGILYALSWSVLVEGRTEHGN